MARALATPNGRGAALAPAEPTLAPRWLATLVLAACAALAACTVQLVPDYDQSLVNGLRSANERTQRFFAQLEEGGAASSFEQRRATYQDLIGTFDALRLEAASRPVPESAVAERVAAGAGLDVDPDAIDRLQNPTPGILAAIVDTLRQARTMDADGRLSPTAVEGLQRSYETSMMQALVFEKALQRGTR